MRLKIKVGNQGLVDIPIDDNACFAVSFLIAETIDKN
jgi:hypothetical protein